MSLADWLALRFPDIAAEVWSDRFRRGLIVDARERPLVPGTRCEPRLRVGYYREVPDEPTSPEIEIVAVDDHLIVVDKPHFLPVTPSGSFVERCVLYQAERRLDLDDLAPVHRLDRHTAGLVLLARIPAERGLYGGLFARGEIERCYEAIGRLDREPKAREWHVASRIVAGEPFFRMREAESGEPNAETRIELVRDLRGPGGATGWGLFRLRPATGKKHQLRLHMAGIGCPISGDRYYPELLPELPDDQVAPLALVATELRFEDPVSGRRRRLRSRKRPALPGESDVYSPGVPNDR